MKTENATLKDIARVLGVSATTVHRALQGKGRISEETRGKVMQTAAEMGYRSNYMAASLKRKNVRFAIAFPESSLENRYYYLNLWQGARQFLESVSEFNVESREYFYPLTPEGNGMILKKICEEHADEIDGVLTIASNHSQSSYFIERLKDKGIPVALVGADLHRDTRFCCVKSYDEIAGNMAAELLTAFHPRDARHKIIVTGNLIGSLTMMDQYDNSRGFEQYIERHAPNTTLLPAYNSDTKIAFDQMKSLLQQHPDVYAIYSCSARHTIQMCRAAMELELSGKVRLVGNDCFDESNELLRKGVLTAIIDKKIARQSYLAMQVLFNYVVKDEYPSASTLFVRPAIVMKSNVETERMVE